MWSQECTALNEIGFCDWSIFPIYQQLGCEGLVSGLPRNTGPEPGLGQLDIVEPASESLTLGFGVKG